LGRVVVRLYTASWWRQGEVLEGELMVAAAEEGQQPEQVE